MPHRRLRVEDRAELRVVVIEGAAFLLFAVERGYWLSFEALVERRCSRRFVCHSRPIRCFSHSDSVGRVHTSPIGLSIARVGSHRWGLAIRRGFFGCLKCS